MKKPFLETEAWKIIRTFLQILAFAAVIWLFCQLYNFLMSTAKAESFTEAYVLCDDCVNIRREPSKKSTVIGQFECGEKLYLDGKKKNGYLHCTDLHLEEEEGWIHAGYVIYDEPIRINQSATIISKGRLAARKYVSGKRTRWLKSGASVTVHWWSDDWCLTNCGYIQTKFLELEGE